MSAKLRIRASCHPKRLHVAKGMCASCYSKDHHLKFKYGISADVVKEMIARQGNVCAICGTGDIPLQIDHCHSDGKIRGMLCAKCNQGLGLFHDNQTLLKNAWGYLTRSME